MIIYEFQTRKNERETYLEFKNESQDVEFKSIWKDEYLNCICSFANAQGGRLFIGADEDKKVTDEDLNDKDQQILILLKDNPMYTYAELALLLGVNKKTIVSRFKNLKNKKIVRRI